MRVLHLAGWAAAGALAACAAAGAAAPDLSGIQTGLEGRMTIGPIQPVCRVEVPCEGPLSASFQVLRNDHEVARFTSGTDGQYEVRLPPGPYTIVPTPDAPMISPLMQSRVAVVEPAGVTHLDLDFDTGIR